MIEDGRHRYMSMVSQTLKGLKDPEQINLVNNGIIGSVSKKVDIPLGFIMYHTRGEGLLPGFKCESYEILNSIYNREPFLKDVKTFVSKTAYLIRYMYGAAAFQELPVSLISNGVLKVDSGIIMVDCLLGKDRGHFMTVLKYMVTEGQKRDEDFWKKVCTKLKQETTEGNSTPASLVEFQNKGLMDKLYKYKSKGVDKYSLVDLMPSEIFNRIYTVEETINIRLETIATHKTEIRKINNGENSWKSHNHGLTELTDALISRVEWGYNQNAVDEMCSESSLMRGEEILLRSRSTQSFSGYLTEPLMLFVSSLEMSWTHDLYKFLGGIGSEHSSYVDYIADSKVDTATMNKWLNRLQRISKLTGNDGANIWMRLDDAITNHHEAWLKTAPKVDNNYLKLRPTSMDTGLLYIRAIHQHMSDMGYKREREGTYDYVCIEFVDYMIDLIDNNTHKYEEWMSKTASSWKGRFEVIFRKAFDEFVDIVRNKNSKVESESKLKNRKLRELRTVKVNNSRLPIEFQMYDRVRTGEWKIVNVNLDEGDGFQLCHYTSEANGGLRTDENTFIGPGYDNNTQGSDNCPKDYLMLELDSSMKENSKYGEFWKRFSEEVEYPKNPMSAETEAWTNTMKFCIFSTEINKNKEK